jgi:regulatory protein
MKSAQQLSVDQILEKISHYCAYQERAHRQVKQKLLHLGVDSEQADQILARLITDGFLNEERFAKSYAGGKFRMMKWGRLKIVRELEQLAVSAKNVQSAMKEINEVDYQQTLRDLLHRKMKIVNQANPYQWRDKLARYAISKGYEPDLVWQMLGELTPA